MRPAYLVPQPNTICEHSSHLDLEGTFFYVVAEDVPIGMARQPRMVAVANVSIFLRFARKYIIRSPKEYESYGVHQIHLDDIKKWGLRYGDLIAFDQTGRVRSVNYETNYDVVLSRQELAHTETVARVTYPTRPLLIELFGDTTVRTFSSIAPLGDGSRNFNVAEGRKGKTHVVMSVAGALALLTLIDPSLYVLVGSFGERAEDVSELLELLERTPHDPHRVELFQASRNEYKFAIVDTWQLWCRRAEVLTAQGYHVVEVGDSATRLLDAYSNDETTLNAAARLISGGFTQEALLKVQMDIAVGAVIENAGSLTQFLTMLTDYQTKGSLVAVLATQVSENVSTSIWRYAGFGPPYPCADVNPDHTYTRMWERFCSLARVAYLKDLQKSLFKNSEWEKNREALIRHCEAEITPPWLEEETQLHYGMSVAEARARVQQFAE